MLETTILGHSQTFFGVLTTLIILCTIFNDSNFINKIIEKFRDEMKVYTKNSCAEYKKYLESKITKVKEKIIIYIDAYTHRVDDDKINKTTTVLDEIELLKVSLENNITDLEKKRDLLFSRSEMDEQISTPLYAFLFCLIVFIFEEIVLYFDIVQNWVTTFLYIFTVLSFALCTYLWIFYYRRTRPEPFMRVKKDHKTKKETNKNFGIVLFYSSLFIMLFVAVYFLSSLLIEWTKITYAILIFVFLFFGALLFSHSTINSFTEEYSDYAKLFIVKHFIYLFIVSLIFLIILFLFSELDVVPIFFNAFSNSIFLKLVLFLFVLLNGILLPFVLPIIRYSNYKKFIKNEIESMKNTLSQKEVEVNSTLLNAER